jgi:hypothetical protein
MEVLANVESPPEAKQARMEYQVSQLAEKMKQKGAQNLHAEAESLQAQWHLSGMVNPQRARDLEERFSTAVAGLDAIK